MSSGAYSLADLDDSPKQQGKYAPDDLEESPPKKYLPAVNKAVASVPKPDSPLNYAEPGNDVTGAVTGFFPTRTPKNGPRAQLPAPSVGAMTKAILSSPLGQSESELIPGAGTEVSAAQHLATPGKRWQGATEAVQGVGEAVSPFMGPAAAEMSAAPALVPALKFGAGLGAGMIAQPAAEKVAGKLGAGPDQQKFWGELAFWAPATAGLLSGTRAETIAGGKGASVTAFGDRAGVSVAATPEGGVAVRGKVGPFERTKVFGGRTPAGPAIEPPTIEATPPDPATEALVKSQQIHQAATRAVNGQSPVAPPPPPPSVTDQPGAPPELKQGVISQKLVNSFAGVVSQLPETMRAQAVQEAHAKLAQVLLEGSQKGPMVGPDGKLITPVKDPDEASKVAVGLINDAITGHEKASAKTQGEGAGGKGAAAVPAAAAPPKPGRSRMKAAELAKPTGKYSTDDLAEPVEALPVRETPTATQKGSEGEKVAVAAKEPLTEGLESPHDLGRGTERRSDADQSAGPSSEKAGSRTVGAVGESTAGNGAAAGRDTVLPTPRTASGAEGVNSTNGGSDESGKTVRLLEPSPSEDNLRGNRNEAAETVVAGQTGRSATAKQSGPTTELPTATLGGPGNRESSSQVGASADTRNPLRKGDTAILSRDLEVSGKQLPAGTKVTLQYLDPKGLYARAQASDGTKFSRGLGAFTRHEAKGKEVPQSLEKGSAPKPAASPETDRGGGVPATTERRSNIAERKRVSEMSHEERGKELLASHVVDLPNRRGFDEAGKSPAVAMSDADGLKALNDKFGYEAGNELLRAKAEALKQAGLEAYHDKGDEFLYRGASPEELHSKLEKAREILRNRTIEVQMTDGSVKRFKGADFSHGTGKDLTSAEAGLKAHKSEREARGERARGELRGITEARPKESQVSKSPEVEKPTKYKFGNTQAPIHPDSEAAKSLESARSRISESDLAGKGRDIGDGGNHVTVRYGIQDDETGGIKKFLSQQAPFEASLGKTDSFPPSEHSDGAAPIIAPVNAPDLHRLNAELEKHGNFSEPSFKEFKPHATIGYVAPEKASRYTGMSVTEGKKFTVDRVAITDRNGGAEIVKLEGKGANVAERPPMSANVTKSEPSAGELKARIAALESKKTVPPVKHEGTTYQVHAKEVADRLRKSADSLDKHIENGRRPMTQNPTPKRMAEYRSRSIDADELERTQKAMRALADAHEADTITPDLAGLRSRDEIGRLVHKGLDTSRGGYYDRIPSREYRDKTPAGKKLQVMIEGAKSPEATAAKLAKEKASKISELEADMQFRPMPGYFPTPKAVVSEMLDAADIKPGMSVLEPSAGKGNIADAIREQVPDAKLSVVEQSPKLQEILKLKDHNLVDSDFLEHDGHYDRIVMNPPFEKGADVEHVRHAFELLKPGGRLVAIMSPHAEFANDKKSVDFRNWVESLGGESEKLPEGSFKESGTGVNSRMVTIDKPEKVEPVVAARSPEEAKPAKEKPESLLSGESGEFKPGELVDTALEATGAVGQYLRDAAHFTHIARDLQRDLETLDTRKQALVLNAVKTFQKLKKEGLTKEDDEKLYHFIENPETENLGAKQEDWLDQGTPLLDTNAELYTELTDGGVPIENYVHRVVKGKGGVLDRIAQGVKGIGQKATLSKSAPQTKSRTYMALENQNGTRQVVSIKGGQVTGWNNGTSENLGGISHTQEGNVFEDKDGNIWNLKQATTKEIEKHTETRYYHSFFASTLVSNIQLQSAVNAMRFLNEFKASPEFKETAFDLTKGNPPKGWQSTNLMQFKGYAFEPRTAEVLDAYYDRMRQGNLGALDQVGKFMRVAMLLNPIMHPMNVAASWAVERGATGFLLPQNYRAAWRSGNKAVKAVLSQNQDFLDALDAGAPLQSHREAMHDISKLFFDQLAEGLDKKDDWAMRVAKSLGIEHGNLLNILHKFSSKVAWASNDILFLQSAYEHQAQGMSLDAALKETGRIIPEYRVPTRILDSPLLSKLMTNKWATIFGSYHYGLLKSFSEVAKSALGAQEPPPGSTRAKEVAKGWDRLALMALVTMALYPILDELAKKATGDKHARVRRAGPFAIIDAAIEVAQHKQSASTAIQRVVTPAPQTKAGAELLTNREFYAGHAIYDPHASFKTQGEQIGRYLLGETTGQIGQYEKAQTTEQKKRFAWGQVGVQFHKTAAEKTAADIAMSKVGTQAEDPEDQKNRVLRREILEQLRTGNSKPLRDAEGKREITPKQAKALEHRAHLTPLQDTIHGFTYAEARKVYEVASPEEKKELDPIMRQKRSNLFKAGRGKEATSATP